MIKYKLLDKSTKLSALNALWKIASGPLTIFLVSKYTSAENQGYYYIFFNLLAAQQIFEAGIGFGLLRTISQNYNQIAIIDKSIVINSLKNENIFNYIKITLLWFLAIGLLILFLILPIGYIFFNQSTNNRVDDWIIPWILFCLSSSVITMISPMSMILEGAGRKDHIYRSRLIISIIGTAITWLGLIMELQLYVLTLSNLAIIVFSIFFYIYPVHKSIRVLYNIRNLSTKSLIFFIKDQWKISTVWSTGYLAWNIFPIVIFRVLGAEVAGKFGMVNAVLGAISQFSSTPVNTRTSNFGSDISSGNTRHAIKIFQESMILSSAIYFFCIALILLLKIMLPELSIFKRMLPTVDLLIYGFYIYLIMLTAGIGLFGRMIENEPYFIFALSSNFLIPFVIIISQYFSPNLLNTITILAFLQFGLIIWAYSLYKKIISRKLNSEINK